MKKEENYQFNIFINQKECIDFERENDINTKKISYDHYVILSFIIIAMKYENNFFKHKYFQGDSNRYILLNNSIFLNQLPKIKIKMVFNKLVLLKELGYILITIENNNERYIAVNYLLLLKWIGTNKNTHTKYLKKHDELTYLKAFDMAKNYHGKDEAENIFLTFDVYRYFEGNYDLENIKQGLIKFITSWKKRV